MTNNFPHNLDAERAVLGSILLSQDVIEPVQNIFRDSKGQVFYLPLHDIIFSAMWQLHVLNEPIDGIVLCDRLGADVELDYIIRLTNGIPNSAHAEHYAKIVLDNYRRRKLILASNQAGIKASRMDYPIDDTITEHKSAISMVEPVEEFREYCDDNDDPGPIPADFLEIPGFIKRVSDFSMSQAPYPNPYMSFCGAISLLSMLTARKVTDSMNTRTNLYILGLAEAGSGKNMPRTVNSKIMYYVGKQLNSEEAKSSVVNRFGSAEGLEDALTKNPRRLWQCDEIDTLIEALSRGGDTSSSKMMQTLLQVFTDSGSIYTRRLLAHAERVEVIHNPCLSLFGTAIPKHFYDALSEKMMSNGFFARQLVIEDSTPRKSQRFMNNSAYIPSNILEEAQYWWLLNSNYGSTPASEPPKLEMIPYDSYADRLFEDIRDIYDTEYEVYRKESDPLGTSVWGRAGEMTRKLALLYACSLDCQNPIVDFEAMLWASRFIGHQSRRMIFKAKEKAYSSDHEKSLKKVIEILRHEDRYTIKRGDLARKMQHLSKKELDEVVSSMVESKIVDDTGVSSGRGRPAKTIRLID